MLNFRITILQHVAFEGPAAIEQWATERKFSISICHLYQNEPIPETQSFDMLIVMGGPMSVYDEAKFNWLKDEKALIAQAIKEKKKVLGICLGAQLIASALNANVYPSEHKEIGWWNVKRIPEAENNPLGTLMPLEHSVFQWHGDTFDLPEACTHLTQSQACKNQAFAIDDYVLALQYHLEVLPQSIDSLITNCADDISQSFYIQPIAELNGNKNSMDQNKVLLFKLLDRLAKQC